MKLPFLFFQKWLNISNFIWLNLIFAHFAQIINSKSKV